MLPGSLLPSESYMASDDPDFERRKVDVIALLLIPRQDAAFVVVDEKSATQALRSLDPFKWKSAFVTGCQFPDELTAISGVGMPVRYALGPGETTARARQSLFGVLGHSSAVTSAFHRFELLRSPQQEQRSPWAIR